MSPVRFAGDHLTPVEKIEQQIEELKARPHGRACGSQMYKEIGEFCIRLCDGNKDVARTLWKEIYGELGYMPASVHVALKWAAKADELMPDVQVPEVGG